MTIDEINAQLITLQQRIQDQTQAILAAEHLDRKEDLTLVRDTLFTQMAQLLEQRSQLESAEEQRLTNELQRIESGQDFRILKR